MYEINMISCEANINHLTKHSNVYILWNDSDNTIKVGKQKTNCCENYEVILQIGNVFVIVDFISNTSSYSFSNVKYFDTI